MCRPDMSDSAKQEENDFDWRKYSLADFVDNQGSDFSVVRSAHRYRQAMSAEGCNPTDNIVYGPAEPRVSVRGSDGVRRDVLNFGRYNYLGLSNHPRVIEGAVRALKKYGLSTSASPLGNGTADLHETLCERICEVFGFEKAILFSAGYNANVATISGVLRPGDMAIVDRNCHASILDGVLASRAQFRFFRHNDLDSLWSLLKRKTSGRKLVIAEALYSADGDRAPLAKIAGMLADRDARLLVDEAHSAGNYGLTGGGVSQAEGILKNVDYYVGTFSKTFGGVGGFLGGTREMVDYISIYGRAYMFSCAVSPPIVGGVLAALDILEEEGATRRERLHDNASYLRDALVEAGFNIAKSDSYIVPVICGDDQKIFDLATTVQNEGLLTSVMTFPAVQVNTSRLRLFVTCEHSTDDMDRCVEILKSAFAKLGLNRSPLRSAEPVQR